MFWAVCRLEATTFRTKGRPWNVVLSIDLAPRLRSAAMLLGRNQQELRCSLPIQPMSGGGGSKSGITGYLENQAKSLTARYAISCEAVS